MHPSSRRSRHRTPGGCVRSSVPAEFVGAQIDAVFSDLDVGAVKIGMVWQQGRHRSHRGWTGALGAEQVVLDPVMVASSGDALLAPKRARCSSACYAPARSSSRPISRKRPHCSMRRSRARKGKCGTGGAPARAGAAGGTVKGGHGCGAQSVDLLVEPRVARAWRPIAWQLATPTAPVARCLRRSLPAWQRDLILPRRCARPRIL